MTYRAMGSDFTQNLFFGVVPNPFDYLIGGQSYTLLAAIADDVVTILMNGGQDSVKYGAGFEIYIEDHPEITAIFSGHESSARLIASTVLDTLVAEERAKPRGSRADYVGIADKLVDAIIQELRNGGDPSACLSNFQKTFADWQGISALSVSKSVSSTGWCKKAAVFGWDKNGAVKPGCSVQTMCQQGFKDDGTLYNLPAPAPPASDIRVSPPASGDTPTPTHADIQAAVQKKMSESGETLSNLELQQAMSELAGYLDALGTARRWMTYALGLPLGATDAQVSGALKRLRISPAEAADWFRGCDFDPMCFRLAMNTTIGEAEQSLKDNRAKVVVALGAVAALGVAVFWGRRL